MVETSGPRLVEPDEARRLVGGLSESTVRRLVAAGQFPKPITLSRDKRGKPARVAWILEELEAWCAARIAADRGVD